MLLALCRFNGVHVTAEWRANLRSCRVSDDAFPLTNALFPLPSGRG
jgi:hypothetical protein